MPVDLDTAFAADVPHLHEYWGLWAIQEEPFRAAVSRVQRLDLRVHVDEQKAIAARADRGRSAGYEMTDEGVAVIPISGPMMKYASSLSGGTSTVRVRRQIRQAAADEEVKAILLVVDSPGGTVSGTFDLAADVAAAAKQKPLDAYIEDLGASAAYAVASQARKIYANPTALIGSIGTFAVIYDQSARAAKLGLKVHVIRAGEMKGAGTPGTEITREQLDEWQRIVEESNEFFLAAVARGRGISEAAVRDLADGRVHHGAAAIKLKLIDGVQSLDVTVAGLVKAARSAASTRKASATVSMAGLALDAVEWTLTTQQELADAGDRATKHHETGESTVSQSEEKTTTPQPASYEDLKACLPGADAEFLCGQLEKKATLDQAQSAWMEEQNKRLAKAEADRKAAEEKAETKANGAAGGEGVGEGTAESTAAFAGDAVAEFNRQVREKMRSGMERRRAVVAVARADPDLHEAFLRATNKSNARVQQLIGERCAMARG